MLGERSPVTTSRPHTLHARPHAGECGLRPNLGVSDPFPSLVYADGTRSGGESGVPTASAHRPVRIHVAPFRIQARPDDSRVPACQIRFPRSCMRTGHVWAAGIGCGPPFTRPTATWIRDRAVPHAQSARTAPVRIHTVAVRRLVTRRWARKPACRIRRSPLCMRTAHVRDADGTCLGDKGDTQAAPALATAANPPHHARRPPAHNRTEGLHK